MDKQRLIIGVSGASGSPLVIELLRQLRDYHPEVETHLIVTRGGEMTLSQEGKISVSELSSLADITHDNENIGAGPASGSFKTAGMIVIPCSMKTVAGIVSGYSDNLLLRAADVTLKERRKLILVARETPLSTIHLRNLYEVSQLGATVLPPMLTYYHQPQRLEDCTGYIVERILTQFSLDINGFQWEGIDETL